MAERLLVRLQLGGFVLGSNEWSGHKVGDPTWLKLTPPEDKPFLPAAQVEKVATGVGKGVISQLHLGAMPTEAEVALVRETLATSKQPPADALADLAWSLLSSSEFRFNH